MLNKGQVYRYREVSIRSNRSKYRLVVAGAQPELRWVDGRCVKALAVQQENNSGQRANGCTALPDQADSNVLALSWQSAFCESKRDKAECQVRDPSSFQANNFTLHGLWPNRDNCNRKTGYYGYCGTLKMKPKQFCDYPKLALSDKIRAQLNINMPSAAHGTCLQRHEWYKHGTCQTQMNVNQYYNFAISLQNEVNHSAVIKLMRTHIGKRIVTADFFNAFDSAFGEGAHQKLQLKCRGGNLVDVYINLPKDLDPKPGLKGLLNRAANHFKNGCGARFTVDAIND